MPPQLPVIKPLRITERPKQTHLLMKICKVMSKRMLVMLNSMTRNLLMTKVILKKSQIQKMTPKMKIKGSHKWSQQLMKMAKMRKTTTKMRMPMFKTPKMKTMPMKKKKEKVMRINLKSKMTMQKRRMKHKARKHLGTMMPKMMMSLLLRMVTHKMEMKIWKMMKVRMLVKMKALLRSKMIRMVATRNKMMKK